MRGQVFSTDAVLSVALAVTLLMFVFPSIEKKDDYAFSALANKCSSLALAGQMNGTFDFMLANAAQRDSAAAALLSGLPQYMGGEIALQNSTLSYLYNSSARGDKQKVAAYSTAVYANKSGSSIYATATLRCWPR